MTLKSLGGGIGWVLVVTPSCRCLLVKTIWVIYDQFLMCRYRRLYTRVCNQGVVCCSCARFSPGFPIWLKYCLKVVCPVAVNCLDASRIKTAISKNCLFLLFLDFKSVSNSTKQMCLSRLHISVWSLLIPQIHSFCDDCAISSCLLL